VSKQVIKSTCVRLRNKLFKTIAAENGQALPIVLAMLAIGSLVIGPFLNHAGTSLMSSKNYQEIINETYAGEAGVEQSIWALTKNGLELELPELGDTIAYHQNHTINGLTQEITVTKTLVEYENSAGEDPVGTITDSGVNSLKYASQNKVQVKTQKISAGGDNGGSGSLGQGEPVLGSTYRIQSVAGNTMVTAFVKISNGIPSIITWSVSRGNQEDF
jgi:hypothetical protein